MKLGDRIEIFRSKRTTFGSTPLFPFEPIGTEVTVPFAQNFQPQIQRLLPGISLRQIKNARKHAEDQGPGEPVLKEQIFRCRLDMKKVKDFVDFISRSIFLQDVAFGTKTLKLHSGEFIPIPALVRTMRVAKIVYLHQEECKRENKDPLKERTCFRIIEVCSASKQKSLQSLDNTSTPAAEPFETLQTLVVNLERNGAGVTWSCEIGRALTADNQYIKGEYKSHLGPDECCADHCTVYTLSDPQRERNLLLFVTTATI